MVKKGPSPRRRTPHISENDHLTTIASPLAGYRQCPCDIEALKGSNPALVAKMTQAIRSPTRLRAAGRLIARLQLRFPKGRDRVPPPRQAPTH